MRLQQTQLAGACDGFGAALNLEFVEDSAVVPFDRVQGEEKPFADLTIRESLGNELQYFQLALAQWLKHMASWIYDLRLRQGRRLVNCSQAVSSA